MAAVGVGKRPNKAEVLRKLSNLREQSADRFTGDCGADFTHRRTVFHGGRHLGIERFDVGWSTPQPQPDDRGVFNRPIRIIRRGASPQQVGQRQTAGSRAAGFEPCVDVALPETPLAADPNGRNLSGLDQAVDGAKVDLEVVEDFLRGQKVFVAHVGYVTEQSAADLSEA